ncbi:uncharacterized protein N7506_009106 [Penicillium brevicompactum]|uniref:uncharacterized protein n=1 Tax=Penicillium brevicompactum TaxID=5074 RepID=UPI002540C945|nr:uncharacterized protein N7506_009106 [Penicillium brevicompactum]KAJ5326004.1 hypothetical protein N7506_009106 [Penicillium brevicompactum]
MPAAASSVGDQHRGGAGSVMMPNSTGATANPFEEPQRRINEYTAQEIATLQARLDKKLGPEYISARPGAAGQKVHYLSADKCINLANEVFGFNGWSSSIQTIQIDFVEENQNTGKISLGLSVIMRVTLRDGTFHEDIGYGHIENCKGKAAAFEKAKKEGTTDALKRALRNFGNVLGNCIYDKDYVSKVTKVKAAPVRPPTPADPCAMLNQEQGRWDVEDLHRHPDYAPPAKKQPPLPPPKAPDNEGTPIARPIQQVKANPPAKQGSFDGEGEFGSDLFDEADFGVAETGNPDEIVIDTEPQRRQAAPSTTGPVPSGPPVKTVVNPSVVTPSKPERWGPAGRPIPPNGRPNPAMMASAAAQGRPIPGQGPPNVSNPRASFPPQQPPGQAAPPNNTAQPPIKRENPPPVNQDMNPPAGTPSGGFFSARAVDLLRDNPNSVPSGAPQFDPHAESPSIRKTAGVDHTKSVPISRPMLSSASPAPSTNSRDYVNPAADMQRRVGAPGATASPVARGQSVSSYRPLTRPNPDQRSISNPVAMSRGSVPPAQNLNGKRPPLADVNMNDSTGAAGAPVPGPTDPKRPRVLYPELGSTGPRAPA